MNNKTLLTCPYCESTEVAVTVEQKFLVNTGDHYCYSVKDHDAYAKVTCLDCNWTGRMDQLNVHTVEN